VGAFTSILAANDCQVHATDSDVTFESCNKALFKVHRKNLECTSEGFAFPDGTVSTAAQVPLSETAEVLELLFQYMYPQRAPDLKTIEFKVMVGVAEAAEKYQVYAAMELCNHYMGYVSFSKVGYLCDNR
jgi:hypothetical protein